MGVHTLYDALSQQGLLDPIKPAYNQSRPDGRLKLTASAFNRLWIGMLAVLVTVTTATQNLLHPLSTYSITARHLLDFMMVGEKITEAEAPTICLEATPSGLSVPPPPSSAHFYAECPFNPSPQFILAWDRHRILLACIPAGFKNATIDITVNSRTSTIHVRAMKHSLVLLYLAESTTQHTPISRDNNTWHSTHPNTNLRSDPFVHISFGTRSCSTAAPKIWNSLPPDVQMCTFCRHLKSHCFQQAFQST